MDVEARGRFSDGVIQGETYATDFDGRAVVTRVHGKIGRSTDGELTGRIVAKGYVRSGAKESWTPAGWTVQASPPHRAGYVRPNGSH